MQNKQEEHNKKIVEQFSKQAVPFKLVQGHYNCVDTIIEMSDVSSEKTVLDLACGTAIVGCEFAKYAKHVTGIDITKEMLHEAKKLKKEKKLENITFELNSVDNLSYEENFFDIVFTRYSFHHFLDVNQVFKEMIRVCKPNGKIIVVDVALEEKYAQAYNNMEKLRDPSHTRALTNTEFEQLFSNKQLSNCSKSNYSVKLELEEQLNASFPNSGDDEKIRNIFQEDIIHNHLGVKSYSKDSKIYFSYPITIFVATKI